MIGFFAAAATPQEKYRMGSIKIAISIIGKIKKYAMHPKTAFLIFCVFLCVLLCTAGCTTTQAPPVTPAPAPATTVTGIQATAPPAPAEPAATVTTAAEATKKSGTVIFTKSDIISPTTYKTYDFRTMGEPLQKLGTSYTIIIKAEKPVLGYAVTTYQADQLKGDTMTPKYVSHSNKIQWGLAEPYMVMEKATDDMKTFSVEKEAFYAYVIDGRWMQSVDEYASTEPFGYTLTIMKP